MIAIAPFLEADNCPGLTVRRVIAALAGQVRIGLGLALLVCFCWQVSLSQEHIHPIVTPASAAAGTADAGPLVERAPTQPVTPDACPLCRELFHTGHALPGSAPEPPPPPSTLPFHPLHPRALASVVQHPFLAWYSRGPPAGSPIR